MPSRRAYIAALGTVTLGGLAGCGSITDDSLPAGTLRFINDHTLPHTIRMEVTEVGATPGDDSGEVTGDVIVPPTQRSLTTTTTVRPNTTQTYEHVFTEPVYYAVQFRLDDEIPADTAGIVVFNPADADGGTWETLAGKVYGSGEFSWVVSATTNPGNFKQ